MFNVAQSYEDEKCPDCGEEIPLTAVDGSECNNCGHVFYAQPTPKNVSVEAMENIINETVADANPDVLAAMAGFLFGGKCEFSYEKQEFIFTPNDDYQGQFE